MTRPGQSFEDAEVAGNYRFRPDYPLQIYEQLISLSPGLNRALDLGCGTGKIARNIAPHFKTVTAIDPSLHMLRIAKELHAGHPGDIDWVHGLAESAELGKDPFDLVVAAASIHWMDHEVLFPRLRHAVNERHVFAVVDGDGAHEPAWQEAWEPFLVKWIGELKNETYEPGNSNSTYMQRMTRYRDWVDLAGEMTATHEVSQTIEEFIRCQHSRDTFAPTRMTASQRSAFASELDAILQPHAVSGMLCYTVQTRVEWGTIKSHQPTG